MEIIKKLEKIKEESLEKIERSSNIDELGKIRIFYLGRKGEIALIMRNLKNLPSSKKPTVGKLINEMKRLIENVINQKIQRLKSAEFIEKQSIDITADPPSVYSYGHFHPLTQTLNSMINIFKSLGFQVIDGPEIESDWYCFEVLNMPIEHPARDTQDSFYLNDNVLPRTQTSSVQVRYMEKHKPPIRIIAPGRVYRRESDVTHTAMFHQLEGLLIDDRATMADLKGILTTFAKSFFGRNRKVRFRPHHFPYTEPSMEMDISCGICGGKGCRSCKYSGWLEILGSGMVHPQVLKNGGIDPKKYQGFAFGTGIERPTMLKYNVDDIRLFFENDLRFLEQF